MDPGGAAADETVGQRRTAVVEVEVPAGQWVVVPRARAGGGAGNTGPDYGTGAAGRCPDRGPERWATGGNQSDLLRRAAGHPESPTGTGFSHQEPSNRPTGGK